MMRTPVPLTEPPATVAGAGMGRRVQLGRLLARREWLILAAMVAIALASSAHQSTFLTRSNISFIIADSAPLLVLSVAQTVVLLGRGIDLSVAPMLGLSAVIIGFPAQRGAMPLAAAIVLAPLIGAAFGAVNGVLVAVAGLPPIIATLGTLSVFGGLQFVVCNAIVPHTVVSIPGNYVDLGNANVLGLVPWTVFIAVGVTVLCAFVLRHTAFGRSIYAVGNSADAAYRAGIRVRLTLFMTYVLCGVLSGLAGLIYLCHLGSADSMTGTYTSMNLYSIAAALIGGTALTGGRGGVLGSALGAVFLSTAVSAMVFANIDPIWEPAGVGVLILLAVISDRRSRRIGTTTFRRAGGEAS